MFESEIWFKTSRSSGSGGQNVNKVSTKVELNFDVAKSKLLTEEQKQIIFSKCIRWINKEGILKITVQQSRSQFENKEIALEKFQVLLAECFKKRKKRVRTQISSNLKERRFKEKKRKSEIKQWRSKKWQSA